MAKQELTCDDILKELKAKQYRPIYYLMGDLDFIKYLKGKTSNEKNNDITNKE